MDGGRRVFVVADPLDGSAIYAHNLPIWWYSCVGIYGEDGDDSLAGDDGADVISGGPGQDIIWGGGEQFDRMTFMAAG